MWLGVEMTDDQVEANRPKYINRMLMDEMKDDGVQGETTKVAKKNLDMFGNINLHCGMVNDKKKLNLLRNKLQLAASIAEIYRMDKADVQSNNHVERNTKKNLAPAASVDLAEKKGGVSNITKAEIAETLYVEYADGIYLTKHKKPKLLKIIEENINGNPNNPVIALSAKDPILEEESGEWGGGFKTGDVEGGGNVFGHSYD